MDEDEEYTTPSFPWSWKSVFVNVGEFAGSVLDATSSLVGGLTYALAASVNHDIQKREFAEAIALDIESITKTTEE